LDIEAVPVGEDDVALGIPPSTAATAVHGTGERQYFYVLALDAPGGPAWESWGVSRLAATARRTERDSRLDGPFATDGALATTRLERRRSTTDVDDVGATRFFLDRFERSASGEPVALPPVNVPGYALARLGGDATLERWVSVAAAPGEISEARLYRMNIRNDGARIERELAVGGRYAGFRLLPSDTDARRGVVLTTPDDSCGVSQLSTLRLGTRQGEEDEPFDVAGTLELPSGGWRIAAIDRDLVLLHHDRVYALVRVPTDGAPSIVSSRSSDVLLDRVQLLGMNLFGTGRYTRRSIDLTPR
jgi:hypothetical protein